MKFASVPVTTEPEYQAMLDRGVDFCDGCGGRYTVENLDNAQLETQAGYLSAGLVCPGCLQNLQREEEW
jgi:hypothetical protein